MSKDNNITVLPTPPRMKSPVRKTHNAPDGDFSYLEWNFAGPSAPWVHFAHANGFNSQTYTQLLGRVSDEMHLFALDARGHGKTRAATEKGLLHNSWDRYEADQLDFIKSLGRPMILVGHSLGAVTSLQMAANHPEWVRSLLLLDPVILPVSFLRLWRVLKAVHLNYQFPLAARAMRRRRIWPDKETINRVYRGRGGFKSWSCSGCLEEYVEGGTRKRVDGSVELTCDPKWEAETFASLPHTTWDSLSKVQCPVTILYGAKSDTFLEAAASRVRRTLPHVKLISVPDATHFVPMEKMDTVAEAIRQMVTQTKGRNPKTPDGATS